MANVKTIWGKKLDNNNKKKRIHKYLIESIIFTIIMAVIYMFAILISKNKAVFDFFDNYIVNFILTTLVTSSILFIIAFLQNYIVCENKIKKNQQSK